MQPKVGDVLWYRHLGADGPLAATVTRVNAHGTVTLIVLDDGTGCLTDDLGADIKRDVIVRLHYYETSGGECAPRDGGP